MSPGRRDGRGALAGRHQGWGQGPEMAGLGPALTSTVHAGFLERTKHLGLNSPPQALHPHEPQAAGPRGGAGTALQCVMQGCASSCMWGRRGDGPSHPDYEGGVLPSTGGRGVGWVAREKQK